MIGAGPEFCCYGGIVASCKRYRTGMADIMELMNVQTALANARQQKVQAIADWHTVKYQLAAALGKISKL